MLGVACTSLVAASSMWTSVAAADDPRFHATAGAAHALGGPQAKEFGAGGGGSASLELPVGKVFGVQATAGGLVLSAGDSPSDPRLATKSTGTAFLGTVGVRLRPLGAEKVAGPWIDANGGLAQTGSNGRIALDTHIGWDFRVAKDSRWDVGPFIGYTHVFQPAEALSAADARVGWAGIQISLGAPERKASTDIAPVMGEVPPPEDDDAVATVEDICPPTPSSADAKVPEGCPSAPHAPEVRVVGDRLEIDDVIHFEFDSPVIRPSSHDLVKHVARFIIDHPEITLVRIEGHADARGTVQYNQRLSEARAASTVALLTSFGVDASRLRVVGHGKRRLKVDTQLAEPRNRRVEFIVTGSAREASAATPNTEK
ncbi:MAG: OmpA family protein [Deltaproteobacteria bacterium]|nr:OmpA family protein [Deltaproteobacteria bacterium]